MKNHSALGWLVILTIIVAIGVSLAGCESADEYQVRLSAEARQQKLEWNTYLSRVRQNSFQAHVISYPKLLITEKLLGDELTGVRLTAEHNGKTWDLTIMDASSSVFYKIHSPYGWRRTKLRNDRKIDLEQLQVELMTSNSIFILSTNDLTQGPLPQVSAAFCYANRSEIPYADLIFPMPAKADSTAE